MTWIIGFSIAFVIELIVMFVIAKKSVDAERRKDAGFDPTKDDPDDFPRK